MRVVGVMLVSALLTLSAAQPARATEHLESAASWVSPDPFRSMTVPVTLQHDPGDIAAIWTTSFAFADSEARGELGFSTREDGGGAFFVTLIGATGAAAGAGSSCLTVRDDAGEAVGRDCRQELRVVEGHGYELTAVRQVTSAWAFSVRDTATGEEAVLGSVGIGGARDMAPAGQTAVRYGDGCQDPSYSRALFGVPTTSEGPASFSSSSRGADCPERSRVTLTPDGAVQEAGVVSSSAAGRPSAAPLPPPTVTAAPVATSTPRPVTATSEVAAPTTLPRADSPTRPRPTAEPVVSAIPVRTPLLSADTPRSISRDGYDLPWWLPLTLLLVPAVSALRRRTR